MGYYLSVAKLFNIRFFTPTVIFVILLGQGFFQNLFIDYVEYTYVYIYKLNTMIFYSIQFMY
jgi:hypothetical protein